VLPSIWRAELARRRGHLRARPRRQHQDLLWVAAATVVYRRASSTLSSPKISRERSRNLIEINTRARLRTDRTTLTPDRYGDRLDPEPILDALLPRRIPTAA
jgi:hypothetical protein